MTHFYLKKSMSLHLTQIENKVFGEMFVQRPLTDKESYECSFTVCVVVEKSDKLTNELINIKPSLRN